jgi:hypothetical protein
LNVYPLLAFLAPLPLLAAAAALYRSLYPRRLVEEALRTVREYRGLRAEAARGSKRAAKRARALEQAFRAARGLLLRATLVKVVLVSVTYIASSLSLARLAYPAPVEIPLVTVVEGGVPYMPAVIIHFAGYLYGLVLLRDTLL